MDIQTNKIGEYPFKVLPFEVDFRKKLKLPHLTNYLLNCAGYHADKCHYGLEDLKGLNYSWVLSRVAIEMYRYPLMDEKIKIQTWVEGIYRYFSKRDYSFTDANGEIIGYAKTIWAVIDKKTRKPINLSKIIKDDIIVEKTCPIEECKNIQNLPSDNKAKGNFIVQYSDIDMNQHLNSSKYIEHIMNAFTLHKFEHRDVSRFEIDYKSECFFGETLQIHKEEYPDNKFSIELRNEKGLTVSKSRIIFSEKNINESYIKE